MQTEKEEKVNKVKNEKEEVRKLVLELQAKKKQKQEAQKW